jgi:hypothetical protein
MTFQERLLLLFFQDPPTAAQVLEALGTVDGVTAAYLAQEDTHSQRAAMWIRDPLGCLPKGRLALDLQAPLSVDRSEALADTLGGTPYRCAGRMPLPLTIEPGATFSGTLQLCCFQRRDGLTDQELERLWFQEHTAVAIATQHTLGYRQNRVRWGGTPHFDGLVEEYFPPEASTSLEAFFTDGHDSDRMWQNIQKLTESSERFLNLDRSEVVHLTDTRLL